MNLRQQFGLWFSYAGSRVSAQMKPILFVIAYLLCFNVFLFNLPIESPISILMGVVSILVGLALFLEAINLCVMPLAEMCGFHLKEMLPIVIMLIIALVLGSVATFAEPAVSIFQVTQGAFPEGSPSFVSTLIRDHIKALMLAIAAGVGLATVIGALRTIRQWPIKIVLTILISIALVLSIFAYINPETANVVSISWDAGGVATGPITVSFMIAFGLGLNRGGKQEFSGMGIVGIASLTPVILTLLTGLTMFYYGDNFYQLSQPGTQLALWEKLNLAMSSQPFILRGIFTAIKTCVPIVGLLAIIITLFIRKKPTGIDEKVLGFVFLLIGSFLFMDGIQRGLLPLGESIGRNITRLVSTKQETTPTGTLIHNFNESVLKEGIDKQGKNFQYFSLKDNSGKIRNIIFSSEYYNKKDNTYLYIPEINISGPIKNNVVGYGIILVFCLFLGAALTAVEPTLITLAKTLEENTVGVMPAHKIIHLVSMGAGIGLAMGVLRLLFKIPFPPLIIAVYLVLLILTLISQDDFVEIAWDAAGCTTGSITIPLAIALQIGVNKSINGMDAFGLIALTNALAAIGLLAYGLYSKHVEKKKFNEGVGP